MKAHIDAVKTLLAPWGMPVHYGDVPDDPSHPTTYPYVLLWSSAGRMISDEVCGTPDDLNDLLGVTTVAATADAALVAVRKVRSYLMGKRPSVAGRYVQPLRLADSRPVEVDEQVSLPDTNRHPAYLVDLYRLISEPTEEES